MRIIVINPNSSDIVTNLLKDNVKRFENEEIKIDVVKCEKSPLEICSSYDELIAGIETVKKAKEIEKEYDGVIIGCFADPGLRAAREILSIPIVGMYESSAYFAKLNGIRYSIIASGNYKDISPWIGSARSIGDCDNLASIRYINSSVEETVNVDQKVIIKEINNAILSDGIDSIILGCAAFANRGEKLSAEMSIPVIDGIKESISLVQMLVNYRR